MSYETGPFVQAACFCENILVDNTGAVSLIRIIDTITHTAQGPDAPEDMPTVSHSMKLAIMLKPGSARGRSEIRIEAEAPNGLKKDPVILSVQFDGEERGSNLLTDFKVSLSEEGLHWFHIYVGDHHATAIPLRIRYNRIVLGTRVSPS